MNRVPANKVRMAAELLAQRFVWSNSVDVNCSKRFGGEWRANVSSQKGILLAAVTGRTEREVSLRLLKWVCEATIRKVDKELGSDV